LFFGCQCLRTNRPIGLKPRLKTAEQRRLTFAGHPIASLRRAKFSFNAVQPAFYERHIGEGQFKIHCSDIPRWIYGTFGMRHFRILKAADDVDQGVEAADFIEELAPRSLSVTECGTRRREVYISDFRRSRLPWPVHRRKVVKASVRNLHNTYVGLLASAEARRGLALRNCVEDRRFSR
jgi:hypothetical protein